MRTIEIDQPCAGFSDVHVPYDYARLQRHLAATHLITSFAGRAAQEG